MNKNSIGLHKFSRFFSGDDAVRFLCTPRADCNDAAAVAEGKDKPFASTRSVQIATRACSYFSISRWLCLHTLRADCNRSQHHAGQLHPAFASTRSVQIATTRSARTSPDVPLCLHTLRADCNQHRQERATNYSPLPPHAPCRLQPSDVVIAVSFISFASTRSVQIATQELRTAFARRIFASTRSVQIATIHTSAHLRANSNFASTRSVQIATAEMHRMQYALFRTCVELVDSFSVLNKSMLR